MEIVNLKQLLVNMFGTPKYPISGVRCPHMPFVPFSIPPADTPHNTNMTSTPLRLVTKTILSTNPMGHPIFPLRCLQNRFQNDFIIGSWISR